MFELDYVQNFRLNIKQTILIVSTKFAQKDYFKSETEIVNATIEFFIFELV